MQTLAEFLKHDKNQEVVLERIVGSLRERGEWGRRGLFAKIGKQLNLSPAYVGQVLNGKKELTENFVQKMASYLNVSVASITDDNLVNYAKLLNKIIVNGTGEPASVVNYLVAMAVELDMSKEKGEMLQNHEDRFSSLVKCISKMPPERKEKTIEMLRLLLAASETASSVPSLKEP